MIVILQTDLEVTWMNNKELLNQARYQATMGMALRMLKKGIITPEEYTEIETIMVEKYAPFFGTLFSDIDLINLRT